MASIRIDTFQGEIPRLDEKKLDEGVAQTAQNARLWSRTLDSYGSPIPEVYPHNGANTTSFYRYDDADAEYWLEFTTDVDIRGTPIAQDTRNRIYWTDGVKPKKASNTLITTAPPYPAAHRYMGVKAPATAPVYSSGSSGSTETRVYVYTFVTDWGEEGAASPALSQDAELADTITVTISAEVTPDVLYGITKWRLYKSVTSITGEGVFLEIAEQDFAVKTFADNPAVDPTTAITSTLYDEPLDDMEGLVALPNGIFAAFSGREVLFSEPYHPHAWPADYRKAVHADVVALGVIGNSVVVATKENPYIITGIHPETMTQQEVDSRQPCIAKRGLTSTQFGVLYPTPDGLYMIQPGGGRLITKPIITTVEWKALNPETILAEVYDGRYYASYQVDTGGDTTRAGFIFDPAEPDALFTTFDLNVQALHQVISEDRLYILIGSVINRWDADEVTQLDFIYKTRVIKANRPTNFSAGQLRGDFSDILTGTALTTYNTLRDAILAENLAIPGGAVASPGSLAETHFGEITLASDGWRDPPPEAATGIIFRLYAGDTLRVTKSVTDEKPFRLPTGYLETDFELEVEGRSKVRSIAVANSRTELE